MAEREGFEPSWACTLTVFIVDNQGILFYRLYPVLNGEVSELVEGARLETVYGGNVIEGSNPSLSAITVW